MKSYILTAALGALAVKATPLVARATSYDLNTFNFALTLEHVEVAFYTMGLQNYSQEDFLSAGFPAGARNQFVEILEHEQTHVTFLEGLLGDLAVQPCTYKFPVDDVKGFAGLAQVIENVGTGAYLGSTAGLSQQYITGSASILGTEARQASLLAAYVNGVEGWGNAFNIPLTKDEAFTLASPFIVSCPSSNTALVDVHANPPLTFPSNTNPGDTVEVSFTSTTNEQLYVVFLFGLDQIVVPLQDGKVTVPQELAGQVYALISTSGNGVTDGTTVAGPAILQFQFTLEGEYIENQ
ncbi:hypothetical protein H0H92_007868 [Tricholoma furcatifolium]|nr:hypothetical protein H0H92_007868 [Tricholoma furcatifolium]